MEPPAEIARFLADAAHVTGPWRVSIHELADGERASRAQRSRRLLGHPITRTSALAQPIADDLVARLALSTSYVDGDVGCVGGPVGYTVARGTLSIDFVEDCHHVFLTDRGHEGRWALFSPEMATFLHGLR